MLEWLFKKNIVNCQTTFTELSIGEEFTYNDKAYIKTDENTYETLCNGTNCIKWFLVNENFSVSVKRTLCKTQS